MNTEVMLVCTEESCHHNIGCACRNIEEVEINSYGVCSMSPMAGALKKTPNTKDDLQNDTQHLKAAISQLLKWSNILPENKVQEFEYCLQIIEKQASVE